MGRVPKGQRTKPQQRDADATLNTLRGQWLSWYDASGPLRIVTDENFRFNRGGRDQWDPKDIAILEKDKKNPRPIQSFNVCAANVNFLAGYEWDKNQDYRYFPRGTEDEALGRMATAEVKYGMDVGQGRAQLHRWFRKGIIGPPAVLHLCLNYNYTDDLVEGDIDLDVLPENTWAWDVFARRYDKQDAQWQAQSYFMPLDQARKKWKNHEAVLTEACATNWLDQTDNMTGVPEQARSVFYSKDANMVRINRHYSRKPVEVVLLWNKQTAEAERFDTGKDAEAALQGIRDTAGAQAASAYQLIPTATETALVSPMGQAMAFPTPDEAEAELGRIRTQAGMAAARFFEIVTRPTTILRVAHYCGWELLDDETSPYGRTNGDGEIIEVDWRYPYIPFIPYQDTDDFTGIKGVLNDIKDPQRELNWDHSMLLDEIVRGPKGVWLLPKEMHADVQNFKKIITRPGAVVEFVGTAPMYVPPAAMAQTVLPKMQIEMEAIMRISGINAELAGQTTQKTVSGRSIQARQAGGLVGVNSLLVNWQASKRLVGELLIRRVQQYYSLAKMHRILGQNQRFAEEMGLLGPTTRQKSDDEVLAQLKQLKNLDYDCVTDFQEASPTARQATVTLMMQFLAAGMPIPPNLLIEASDVPYKEEITAALAKQGNQLGPPNPELAKAIGAGQGSAPSQPTGVNVG